LERIFTKHFESIVKRIIKGCYKACSKKRFKEAF